MKLAHALALLFVACSAGSVIAQQSPDAFLSEAISKVDTATKRNTVWDGPKTGPRIQSGKSVVYVASDLRNGGVLGVSKGVVEAAKVAGWTLRIIDGQGRVSGRSAAFNQAMALQPDGLILSGFDAKEQAAGIRNAAARKIPIVGWHAASKSGPIDGLFANITTNADDVAEIAALTAIVEAKGRANVVVFTDSAFAAAIAKSTAMVNVLKKCSMCKVLSVEDTPLADTSIRMPQLTTGLLQRFGQTWTHSLAINDLYFDFMAPTLASAGTFAKNVRNISAGDGSESAFQRIRSNQFQAATVPEPLNLQGWQLIDELNRAISGAAFSGYSTPVHLVVAKNIAFDGGPKNAFDPDNGYRDAYKKIWGK